MKPVGNVNWSKVNFAQLPRELLEEFKASSIEKLIILLYLHNENESKKRSKL